MNRLIRSFSFIFLLLLTAGSVKALGVNLIANQQQVEQTGLKNASNLIAQKAIPQQSLYAANQLKITVKEIAPYSQETELQIITVFKHKPGGDTLISAAADLDKDLGGLITSIRDRGEFVGNELETFLIVPPQNSIKPKLLLLIGLGDEQNLSLDTMQRVGTVALRESVRLKATHVSFAPILRDQNNATLDTGDVVKAVAQNVILAYDTEKRLQKQGLAQSFIVREWVFEAGSAFYSGAISKVRQAIKLTNTQIATRSATPYVSGR
ncbi:MAG: M17 family peptidase N-terminal domain-containing protein [Nostoc sp.]|uniref:M17 family peptidase N-terminal domain-containing protein n=1 Tax=Nostoc sp. TaxID=1180 RepID=UPI002FFA1854